jgi:NitT/TauT family transport system substrate-binding protein
MNNRNRSLMVGFILLILIGLIAGSFLLTDDENDDANRSDDLTNVTLFLTFIPNVQFAPVYAAIDNGYFEDEGLNVTIEHGGEADGLDRIAVNDLQFGIISGEQVILARNAEKPVVYVMEWYRRFPVGLAVPADSDIEEPADLEGRTVSISFLEGASYMGLRAVLGAVDVAEDDVTLEPVGFTSPEVMCAGQVDASVVYIANEPLQIEECFDVRVIEFSDFVALVSNGLVTNETTIENDPELVEKMVRALQRGIQFTVDNPDEAFDISLRFVEDLSEDQYEVQREVLNRSIPLWEAEVIGQTSSEAWENTQQALLDAGLLDAPANNLEAAYTNDFVTESE